jgi:hypothetical protein
MPSDPRAVSARQAHRLAGADARRAADQRARRDALVRELRAEDPELWTYSRLAAQVGCSTELVGKIVRGETT